MHHFTTDSERRALVDLFMAFVTAFALLVLNISFNLIDSIRVFFEELFPYNLTSAYINLLFVWLGGMLFLSFLRWRHESAERAELTNVVSSISPDALLVVTPDRTIRLCNGSIRKMFGYSPDEVTNRRTDLLYEDRRASSRSGNEIRDTLDRDGFHVGTASGKRKDGSRFPLEIISAELGGKRGAVLLLRDISERIQAEEERRRLALRIRERQEFERLGTLAGGFAHDFNNLLMVVMGNVDLAKVDIGSERTVLESLNEIQAAAKRGAELCREVLAYAGKGNSYSQEVNLSPEVSDMEELLRRAVAPGARLRFELSPGLPTIVGDLTQIRQIVVNLVTNASDALCGKEGDVFVRTGEIECDGTVLASALFDDGAQPGRYVFLEVEDGGCGMDGETKAHIFQPFFSTKAAGHGLGLASIRGIMRGHHGGILVESEPGKGSKFKVLFPPSARVRQARASDPVPRVDDVASGVPILVVDDEPDVLDVVATILKPSGYAVVGVAGGPEAIALFRKEPRRFPLVMVDMVMPEMDGLAVCRELRRIRNDVRVLLTSGYDEGIPDDLAATGGIDFLRKPYESKVLRSRIKALLE